jgi:3-carboxy-cis,cis-muconate cycloisomerase
VSDAVGDRAWFAAMLDVEAALAHASASAGVIPIEAADRIAGCCTVDRFDLTAVLRDGREAGNPAEPLVRALRHVVGGEAARYVHAGATSQDILDTAAMLVVRRTLGILDEDLAAVASSLAALAVEHRRTVMVGRTLLQQAVPITFGLTAAQWLAGVSRARAALRRLPDTVLAVQLGGAAGTLGPFGEAGTAVLRCLARELDLLEPALPWHTERTRIAEVAGALALTAGALDRIALDITLLAQTEVGEVAESGTGHHGGSSTMPHKRNQVGAIMVRACVRQTEAQAEVLLRSMAQEHERAAGAWQAEWPALSGALAGTAGAAAWLREALDGLQVYPERMRQNLERTGGLIMSEWLAALLSKHLGREEAHACLRALGERARETSRPLIEMLLEDETVRRYLSPEEIERAMAPTEYLGSTDAFIDRALAQYRDS